MWTQLLKPIAVSVLVMPRCASNMEQAAYMWYKYYWLNREVKRDNLKKKFSQWFVCLFRWCCSSREVQARQQCGANHSTQLSLAPHPNCTGDQQKKKEKMIFSLSISYLNSTETAGLDFCASTLGKTRISRKKTRTRLRTKWPSFSSRRLQSFPNERDEILMNLFARPTRFSSVDAVGFSVIPSSSGRADSLCSRWELRKAFAIPGDMQQAETLSDCSGRVSKVEIYILQEV